MTLSHKSQTVPKNLRLSSQENTKTQYVINASGQKQPTVCVHLNDRYHLATEEIMTRGKGEIGSCQYIATKSACGGSQVEGWMDDSTTSP